MLFMGSSTTGAWLGAGRAALASTCAAVSVAHQQSQQDKERAASSLWREEANPCSGGIAVVVYHRTSKCKYGSTVTSQLECNFINSNGTC